MADMFQELRKIKGKCPDSKCWKFCDVFMQITYVMKDKIFHRKICWKHGNIQGVS